jgi:hypothetical protein
MAEPEVVATLRPGLWSRGIVSVGAVGSSFGLVWLATLATANKTLVTVFAAIAVLYLAWLAVRFWFIRVELGTQSMRVVGLVRSRIFARSAILRLNTSSQTPLLVWLDESGRERFSMLVGVQEPSVPWSLIDRNAVANRKIVEAWIDEGRQPAEPTNTSA